MMALYGRKYPSRIPERARVGRGPGKQNCTPSENAAAAGPAVGFAAVIPGAVAKAAPAAPV